MTPAEALDLARRIKNTWYGGPPVNEWATELESLDTGRAGTTYARMKRTVENAPSIARFLAEYRAITTTDASADRCPSCGDSGWAPWLDDNGDPRHYEANGVTYSGALPCNCQPGRRAAQSRAWMRQ